MIFINQWNPGAFVLVMLPTWFHKLIRGRPDVEPTPYKYYSSELFLCEISSSIGTIICPFVVVVELINSSVTAFLETFGHK